MLCIQLDEEGLWIDLKGEEIYPEDAL